MNEVDINVVIASRTYKLTINANDEEIVRKAVNDINEKTKKLSNIYAYKDNQDLLAMTVLLVNTDFYRLKESQAHENELVYKKISDISDVIDDVVI